MKSYEKVVEKFKKKLMVSESVSVFFHLFPYLIKDTYLYKPFHR